MEGRLALSLTRIAKRSEPKSSRRAAASREESSNRGSWASRAKVPMASWSTRRVRLVDMAATATAVGRIRGCGSRGEFLEGGEDAQGGGFYGQWAWTGSGRHRWTAPARSACDQGSSSRGSTWSIVVVALWRDSFRVRISQFRVLSEGQWRPTAFIAVSSPLIGRPCSPAARLPGELCRGRCFGRERSVGCCHRLQGAPVAERAAMVGMAAVLHPFGHGVFHAVETRRVRRMACKDFPAFDARVRCPIENETSTFLLLGFETRGVCSAFARACPPCARPGVGHGVQSRNQSSGPTRRPRMASTSRSIMRSWGTEYSSFDGRAGRCSSNTMNWCREPDQGPSKPSARRRRTKTRRLHGVQRLTRWLRVQVDARQNGFSRARASGRGTASPRRSRAARAGSP